MPRRFSPFRRPAARPASARIVTERHPAASGWAIHRRTTVSPPIRSSESTQEVGRYEMLDRFLVVGLGGSGGRTVRKLRAELNRRLFAAGYRDGLPAGWHFLHVDVPKLCDIEDAGIDTDLPY